jgi:hypothetical protein
MTQGIYINTHRPKSKKAVKEAIAAGLAVYAEGTANAFHPGSEYDGPVDCAPVGTVITFVGPDPYRDRRFYGTIRVTSSGIKVT